jgi:glucose-6-phosphate 1-dehydrogenase
MLQAGPVMPSTFIIFGASGDLTRRKLIPALYHLHRKGRLPPGTKIVGFSRTAYDDDGWRGALAEQSRSAIGASFDPPVWNQIAGSIYYQKGDVTDAPSFESLAARLDEIEGGVPHERIFYLATAPQFYEPAIEQLGAHGLAESSRLEPGLARNQVNSRCAVRVVIEKPFGVDGPSARSLNAATHRVFDEQQIFRIDHYLGKETVQNLLVLRFANSIFEPVWNRTYVDHVQITVAESLDVGRRAGYYDAAGVLRDMFQNHLLQLATVTAMEAPARYTAEAVRNEKVKVLEAIRPMPPEAVATETVRGQYAGYREEPDVALGSRTATFAAVRLWIDNWRWQGVPFYLRSGKAMACRTTQIVVQFRTPPHLLFGTSGAQRHDGNRLVVQIQPAEGIQLHFLTKVPDSEMQLRMTDLDFRFARHFTQELPDAYQRLLLDALEGDASLFARADEVELSWSVIDAIQNAWNENDQPALPTYTAGGWGPQAATDWMRAQNREWFDICPVLK